MSAVSAYPCFGPPARLDKINVAQPILFQTDAMWPYFERLRREFARPLAKG